MINIGDGRNAKLSREHSTTVQRDGKGGFQVNNISAQGRNTPVTKVQFESGILRGITLGTGGFEGSKPSHPTVDYRFPVIYGEKP